MIHATPFPSLPFGFPLIALALLGGIGLESARADAFSDNLAKWQRMRPAHYQYENGHACYCQPVNYLVEAEGTVVTQAKLIPVFGGLPSGTPSLQSHSIDSAFARLKVMREGKPFRLDVTYDREFGFPSSIHVDYNQGVADDEASYAIGHFKVFPPGLVLANDTVFPASIANLPDERHLLRFTNSGDSTLYLNSVELSVDPTDTLSQRSVGVMFTIPSAPQLRPVLVNGYFRTDTVAAVNDVSIAPGKDLVLSDFKLDLCFCLLKTGTKISEGDTLTLMLRLDFSRGEPAVRGDVRAYAYVRGLYRFTSEIARAPEPLKARRETYAGWRGGLWLGRDGVFALTGRRVSAYPGGIVAP
jgi:hypothetical protein